MIPHLYDSQTPPRALLQPKHSLNEKEKTLWQEIHSSAFDGKYVGTDENLMTDQPRLE